MENHQKRRCKSFTGPTLEVARKLLGKKLCTLRQGQFTAGVIVEVEAYHGETDQASHSFRGQTTRNEVMFLSHGHCYVYIVYGIHTCVNVVTETQGIGAAVLIRALEPTDGIELMKRRRQVKSKARLANGPANLCKALGIDKGLNGVHYSKSGDIWIEYFKQPQTLPVATGPRIGISRSVDLPWRLWIKGSPWTSAASS
jgi:DNA-3-methyladenine glycosylase